MCQATGIPSLCFPLSPFLFQSVSLIPAFSDRPIGDVGKTTEPARISFSLPLHIPHPYSFAILTHQNPQHLIKVSFWGSSNHKRECGETSAGQDDHKGKGRICWNLLLMNTLVCLPLFSPVYLYPPCLSPSAQAEIVQNISCHCWRHLGQSCFDFIIHVLCSRLSLNVKDTSGFLLNSLLRIALWLLCLLANTMHSIYCGATSACMSLPACLLCVCVCICLCVRVCVSVCFRHICSIKAVCVICLHMLLCLLLE